MMHKTAIGLCALLLLGATLKPAAAEDAPETSRVQALRALWASDPAFGAPDDVLDIHVLDYSQLGRTQEVVRTAYRPGKGYVDDVAGLVQERLAASPASVPE
jgi:hypothetical protein